MNGIQIPGISNPEAIIPITGEKKSYKLVLDFNDGAISIIEARYLDSKLHREIQDLSDNDVTILGTEISDGAYDENLDIHCDKCNKFYRPYCRLHPLFKIPDRVLKRDESSNLSFSQQTLPILFRIEESKLPNAGLGVIAEVFIPVGMVFGPYKGRRCQKKTDFYKDGYAWLIKSGDKRFYIDGSDAERSNWLRYINSPRFEDEQNMLAFQTNGKIFYRVIKPIRINQELLVWYGSSYGNEFVESENGNKYKKPAKNPFICVGAQR
ncbi:Histone-lysine N-methyltransferase set-17 [Caenorhabditis elegans]|nr:Histone-lysine N-methyltransferase set-17 [Caenorhabditis elegans]SAP35534.1 Histone-lysine N-methyltransferase set-17 [Caenorhabditis elegans]|eukprot:NP_001317779.1 SET (trithorax/polycomb) domain containing [Caenorhabditis elegans]